MRLCSLHLSLVVARARSPIFFTFYYFLKISGCILCPPFLLLSLSSFAGGQQNSGRRSVRLTKYTQRAKKRERERKRVVEPGREGDRFGSQTCCGVHKHIHTQSPSLLRFVLVSFSTPDLGQDAGLCASLFLKAFSTFSSFFCTRAQAYFWRHHTRTCCAAHRPPPTQKKAAHTGCYIHQIRAPRR